LYCRSTTENILFDDHGRIKASAGLGAVTKILDPATVEVGRYIKYIVIYC